RYEHRHLPARVVVARAVVSAAATARDLLGRELLDPVRELGWTGDIAENAGAVRRRVGRTVLGLQEEHRHLVAADGTRRAIVAAAAAAGDSLRRERFDPVGERRRTRHVGEGSNAGRRRVAES